MSAPARILDYPAPDRAAAEINSLHESAVAKARGAVENARRAGELLLEVKARLQHGAFGAWLAANIMFTERTAQRYMAVADNWLAIEAKSDRVSEMTLRGALQAIPRKAKVEPEVQEDAVGREPGPHEVDVVDGQAKPAARYPRHPSLKGTRYRRPNDEIERAIITLEAFLDAIVTIDLAALDRDKAPRRAAEIKALCKKITAFARRVERAP
jgi:hypothetical protein